MYIEKSDSPRIDALEAKEAAARAALMKTYGVQYFAPGTNAIVEAQTDNLYWYQCFIGRHEIMVPHGDALFYIDAKNKVAHVTRGFGTPFVSNDFAVLIRGYMPEVQSGEFKQRTTLPYVNGCSTKQIFPPTRPGDPTLQFLDIPPHASEQAHHIHSTVRCVYVLSGSGKSIVGMDKAQVEERLVPGMVCILEPMCPHHFETDDEHCVVIPMHVWSTVPGVEGNHPMFNGTFMMNQGE